MKKLDKVNNDIYLLMQDIVKLIDRDYFDICKKTTVCKLELFDVNIKMNDLIFTPTTDQLKKALSELQFLQCDWITDKSENALIYFINEIRFSLELIKFKISATQLENLNLVHFNLSKYIDDYIE